MFNYQEAYVREIEKIAGASDPFSALESSQLNTERGALVTLAASGSGHLLADTLVSEDGSDPGIPNATMAAYYANIMDVILFKALSRERKGV